MSWSASNHPNRATQGLGTTCTPCPCLPTIRSSRFSRVSVRLWTPGGVGTNGQLVARQPLAPAGGTVHCTGPKSWA